MALRLFAAKGRRVLAAFSVTPLGAGDSVGDLVAEAVRIVRDSGIATIVVDKTVAAVTEIADRVIVLVKGEIVFANAPAMLLADPELMHRHLGV